MHDRLACELPQLDLGSHRRTHTRSDALICLSELTLAGGGRLLIVSEPRASAGGVRYDLMMAFVDGCAAGGLRAH